MKKKQFYIDVKKAERLNLIGCIKVSINGKRIKNAISAKSGINGFVEYQDNDPKLNRYRNDLITHKARGNVKITIHKPGSLK